MKVILDDGAYLPERAHKGDAGYDLRCMEKVTIESGCSAVFDTGVHMQIPFGYFGKIESKSGLNVNHDIVSLGGVIDCGYQGSIKVKLYNFGDEDYTFDAGDKIAQLIIQACGTPSLDIVDRFEEDTDRGNNGFGSTGK